MTRIAAPASVVLTARLCPPLLLQLTEPYTPLFSPYLKVFVRLLLFLSWLGSHRQLKSAPVALVPINFLAVFELPSSALRVTTQLAARHVDLPDVPLQPRIGPVPGTIPPTPSVPPGCSMQIKSSAVLLALVQLCQRPQHVPVAAF